MKCNSCGADFADGLTKCPSCGKKYPKQYSIFRLFGVGIFIFVVYKAFDKPETTNIVPATVASQVVSELPPVAVVPWVYGYRKDKMTGKNVSLATSSAKESLDFKFPYAGKNVPTLTVRKTDKLFEILLRVEKGQFMCHSECMITMKFDQKAPVNFSAIGPSDGSTEILFLSPASKIVGMIKQAKTVLVQATFYQEGTRTMTFPIQDFSLKD